VDYHQRRKFISKNTKLLKVTTTTKKREEKGPEFFGRFQLELIQRFSIFICSASVPVSTGVYLPTAWKRGGRKKK
jgi:hypothetical protein